VSLDYEQLLIAEFFSAVKDMVDEAIHLHLPAIDVT